LIERNVFHFKKSPQILEYLSYFSISKSLNISVQEIPKQALLPEQNVTITLWERKKEKKTNKNWDSLSIKGKMY
jgi:hypothetical protein